jgi:uncharacterized protein DUF3237
MTEPMPGEVIYEYTIQSTGATSYGVPALEALLSGAADIPPEGARYDLAFQGPIVGQRLRGTVELTDYIHVRPDGRVQLHIHAEITTEDGKKIALYADGVAHFTEGPPVGDLREKRDPDDVRARLRVGQPTSDLGPGHGRPSQSRSTCHGLHRLAPVGQRPPPAAQEPATGRE